MNEDGGNVVELKSKRRGRTFTAEERSRGGKTAAAIGKAKNPKPASGLPASGPGWGGPANGPGTKIPIHEHPANAKHMTGGERAEARRTNEEIGQRALAKIDALIDSDHEGTALQASIAALNRTQGLPVARVITDSQEIQQPGRMEIVWPAEPAKDAG